MPLKNRILITEINTPDTSSGNTLHPGTMILILKIKLQFI